MYIYSKFTIEEMVQQLFSKHFFALAVISIFSIPLHAQISEGGIPLSMDASINYSASSQVYIPTIKLDAPDIEALRKDDSIYTLERRGQLRIGTLVTSDIDIQNSGVLIPLSDGRKIWRLKIQIPGSQALGLYYDKFQLPEGVRYFLFNSNGRQILGAYTHNENTDDRIWANEKVQGETVNLEMDIDAGIDVSSINLHINNVAVFYRATAYLQHYDMNGANLRTTATYMQHYDSSSSCEVDAMCAPGSSFPNQRNASVHIEYVSHGYVFAGSGTMMNNTKQDCAPLLLTATHILNSQNNGNATFSNWVIYFNYQKPTCPYTGAEPSTSQTVVGAYFMARAPYDSSSNKLIGDFMLLLLKKNPVSYGFYLAGWDNTDNSPVPVIPGTYTSFHHPWADVKKVSQSNFVNRTGNFNNGLANSHWDLTWNIGGQEEGSSGGGLFNANGRLIGILSGGNIISQPCAATNSGGEKMSDHALFSKLSLDWTYSPYSTGTSTRLKEWLDPAGTGATTLDGQTGCTTAIPENAKSNNGWAIYPNPTTGIVYLESSIAANHVKVQVYNVLGIEVNVNPASISNNKCKLDMSNYAAGIYFVHISDGVNTISQKITLTK